MKKGNSLLVTDTCRFAFPSAITSSTSSGLETKRSVAPCGVLFVKQIAIQKCQFLIEAMDLRKLYRIFTEYEFVYRNYKVAKLKV